MRRRASCVHRKGCRCAKPVTQRPQAETDEEEQTSGARTRIFCTRRFESRGDRTLPEHRGRSDRIRLRDARAGSDRPRKEAGMVAGTASADHVAAHGQHHLRRPLLAL